MKLILVGAGAWGQKVLKTLSHLSINVEVADRRNWQTLIDKNPDGVIICTPPESHIQIASYSLAKNIPTMIEKPLALSWGEATQLSQFSAPVLVNHIHLFSLEYEKLKKMIIGSKISKILSQGYNKGPIRNYSSLWDYGPHDIALILDLVGEFPNNVKASAIKTNTGTLYDINMNFSSFSSHSRVGNGGDFCRRSLEIIDEDKVMFLEDNKQLPIEELPLTRALQVFLWAIRGKNDFRLGLELPLKVMKVLEMCEGSINNNPLN